MKRIKTTFKNLKQQNKTAFTAFLTAGDPNYETSLEIIKKLPDNGVDIIELGIPFLDPAGDGPTIEAASKRAITNGMNLPKVLQMVAEFRHLNHATPIILMGYYNPIFHYGLEQFCIDAKKSGVDGLLIVDLPPEEDNSLRKEVENNDIDFIKLISPTTSQNRIKKITQNASGFLYLVSILGITGTKSANITELEKYINLVRLNSELPLMVGFGIKTREQILQIEKLGVNGVIVGSALVKVIEDNLDKENEEIVSLVLRKIKEIF